MSPFDFLWLVTAAYCILCNGYDGGGMYRAFQCTVCATPLRSGVRLDCRYCGVRCRVRAHRIRYDGRGLLDVEFQRVVERVIRVEVSAESTQSSPNSDDEPAANANAECTEEVAKDVELPQGPQMESGDSDTTTIKPASDNTQEALQESLRRASELTARLRESEEKSAQLVKQDAILLEEKGALKHHVSALGRELEAARTSLNTTRARLAAKERDLDLVLNATIDLESRLEGARRLLRTREAELMAALEQIDELSQHQHRRQVLPLPHGSPAAVHAQEVQQYRRKLAAATEEIRGLNSQIAQAQSDQAELKKRREEVARLASEASALRRQLLEVATERDALHSQCANLNHQIAVLNEKLRRHEAGTWHAAVSGLVGVAAGVAQAYAEKEGLSLPTLTPPSAKQPTPAAPPTAAAAAPSPPPPSPPPPKPMPGPAPDDEETKRWRANIAEQRRRGWNPSVDMLVLAKKDELEAEDELARAQEKAGVLVTARRISSASDTDFRAQRAAIEARIEHYRVASKNQGHFDKARWDREHYRLDLLSEGRLQQESVNRTMQIRDEEFEIRRRR